MARSPEGVSRDEAVAAYDSLKKAIATLVEQRNYPLPSPQKGYEIGVQMDCTSLGRTHVSPLLIEFIDAHYPGRNLHISHILAALSHIDITVFDPRKQYRSKLEKESVGLGFVSQREEAVLGNTIYLLPSENPMQYGIQTYNVREWRKNGLVPCPCYHTFEPKEADPALVQTIVEMIPATEPHLPRPRVRERLNPFHVLRSMREKSPKIVHPPSIVVATPTFAHLKTQW